MLKMQAATISFLKGDVQFFFLGGGVSIDIEYCYIYFYAYYYHVVFLINVALKIDIYRYKNLSFKLLKMIDS